MPYTLHAPLLLDRKCFAGHVARAFSEARMSGRWRKNAYYALGRRTGISCRIINDCPNSLAGSSTSSWLPIDSDLQRDDVAYGGWSNGGTNIQSEKRKGISFLIFIGGRTSLAICLAILVYLAFSKKGFRARLYAPVAGTHQLFIPLITRSTSSPTKTFEHTFSAAEKAMPCKSEDKYERERDFDDISVAAETAMPKKSENKDPRESDSGATETEVSCVPETKHGKVLIPAVIDSAQWEALSALQKLKIVESHIQPGELCTRREYARWLVYTNSVFSRNPSYRVFPSVYIEGVTVLAFDDITTQDPDFPYIQGLAEAGFIPSKLSINNINFSYDDTKQTRSWTMFYPENHLSRVDLLTWKMYADHKDLPEVDRRTLEKKSGFLDIEQIRRDAWPAVLIDSLAGDKSVTTKAFGYCRRFQPHKPVTKGQALISITSGRVAAMVSEELSRLEAENSAKEAVMKEILSEMISRGEIKSFWEENIVHAKQQRVEAEKILDLAVSELKRKRAEEESRMPYLQKEKAQLEFEDKFLSSLMDENFELQRKVYAEEIETEFEKEHLEKLKEKAQFEIEALSKSKLLAETEKKAVILSRLWVEDEARRIQAQSEILKEALKRWKFTESSECSCWCHQKDRTREDVPEG